MRLAMMIDLDDCIGCKACVSACKERWDSGHGAARDWVRTFEHGTRGKDLGLTFYPGLCMQCEDHPCTLDCPTGATWMDEQGVVVVDPAICIGCGNCVSRCPYGARTPDPDKKIVEKCDLCAAHVAMGDQPACVKTCLAECRIYGDLDDPTSAVSRTVRERKAAPLVTADVNVRPKVTYAGKRHREAILAAGVIRPPKRSLLTQVWSDVTRPAARYGVPAFILATVTGGLWVNTRMKTHVHDHPEDVTEAEVDAALAPTPEESTLHRHTFGMRFLHWFNAASWILLLLTGTALLSSDSFALFGTGFPRSLAGLVGGKANLLALHVGFGLLWALVIIPFFLIFKGSLREIWEEVRLTADDLRWFIAKPKVLLGLSHELPHQDKYNAGQKVFAITALVGTTTLVGSGLVMTFHWGSAPVVAAAILVHKLAILFALMGLAVHITMAALLKSERAALRSMVTGRIDRAHAEAHSTKWVQQIEHERKES